MNQNASTPGSSPTPPPLPPGSVPTPSAGDKAKEAANKASQEAKRFFNRVWPYCQPIVDKAWLNLRVWVPFLANPKFRENQVVYGARESRDAASWTVSLPKQCWRCNTTAGLISRDYERDLRTFEAPVGILACAGGLAAFFFLLFVFFGWGACFLASALSVLGGLIFLYIKSWPEHARLNISTCRQHGDELSCPPLVVYDNSLYVMLDSPELAEAARTELDAKRKAGNRYAADGPAGPTTAAQTPRPKTTSIKLDDEPPPAGTSEASSRSTMASYKRAELPSIKLDDDDAPPAS
jgi:hypothetical protein